MRIDFKLIAQKYIFRASDRLAYTYRVPTLVVLTLTFAYGIYYGVIHDAFVKTAHPDGRATAISVLLVFAPMLVAMGVFILSECYEHHYDKNRDIKLATRLLDILNEQGPLPTSLLRRHYNAHHVFNLPRPVRKLITRDYTSHLFKFNYNTKTISAAENAAPTRAIPYPQDGDYRAAYYQTYARLRAIREHPELATVQDSLIDDLYGVG